MDKFTFFWNGPFSQWYRSLFTIDGITYNCAEQYMMHQKALMMGDTESAKEIMNAGYDPRTHKALGRKVRPFDAKLWNEKCKEVVYKGSYAKFTQNRDLWEELKATAGTTLVEASPYDKIWGIGLYEDDPRAKKRETWLGTNWLGEVLTQVRIDLLGE